MIIHSSACYLTSYAFNPSIVLGRCVSRGHVLIALDRFGGLVDHLRGLGFRLARRCLRRAWKSRKITLLFATPTRRSTAERSSTAVVASAAVSSTTIVSATTRSCWRCARWWRSCVRILRSFLVLIDTLRAKRPVRLLRLLAAHIVSRSIVLGVLLEVGRILIIPLLRRVVCNRGSA